jgi:hypothetical protein
LGNDFCRQWICPGSQLRPTTPPPAVGPLLAAQKTNWFAPPPAVTIRIVAMLQEYKKFFQKNTDEMKNPSLPRG